MTTPPTAPSPAPGPAPPDTPAPPLPRLVRLLLSLPKGVLAAVAYVVGRSICGFARFLTGARAMWKGCAPLPVLRIYFANHSSHADFVLLWASLPPALRRHTRPVAGADYWTRDPLRRFIIHDVFRGVVIERVRSETGPDPVELMVEALDGGDSLILFPEGTRNTTDELLLPFKGGIWRVASARPQVECVPVWIENLNRVMPKGEFVPIPLLCTLSFGEPLRVGPDEPKEAFLERARGALEALRPGA